MASDRDGEKEKIGPRTRVGTVSPEGAPCEAPEAVSCSFIIFGASGDLTRRKLLPSLYRLAARGLLAENFLILGSSRSGYDSGGYREEVKDDVRAHVDDFDEGAWDAFAGKVHYHPVDFGDAEGYKRLKEELERLEKEHGVASNRLIYLATPPSVYGEIIEGLGTSGLADEGRGWTHIVVEKPYGNDLGSALELDRRAHEHFREDQIYRIDHYLGKETVQNVLMLRFANSIFEPIWNRRYVDHVQITVAETLGVEKRAGYYEAAGVLRDMFQNHILQVLSLVALEPPSVFKSELLRDERVKVLRALRPITAENASSSVVAGQYGPGRYDGEEVPGYRDEEGVAPGSVTPTYAAMRLFVDNWRWQGVPFYVRSGKRLKKRFTEITIQFKQVPHLLFEEAIEEEIGPNALVMRIQPDERVQLRFHTKNPGTRMCLRDVLMDFPYLEGYQGVTFDAYERVLLDCMAGEKTLFVRTDGIELSWAFLDPILELTDRGVLPLNIYEAGSWGPAQADELIRKGGRRWINHD